MNKLFLQVLNTSILISILISIIIIINKKFLSKYSHTFNYLLSVIIIIRMLFIIKLNVNIPILSNFFNNNKNITTLNYYLSKVSSIDNSSFNYISIFSIIWMLGTSIILLYYTYFHFVFYFKLNSNIQIPKNDNLQKLLNIQVKATSINKTIKAHIVNGIPSPLIAGIFKNTILLPPNNYTEKELTWIFKHELIHIKRKDNLLKLLLIFAFALHWFNPLFYILRKFFYEQCELSCDEQIIKNNDISEIKEYALLLIKVIKYKNTLKTSAISSKLINTKINITKRRINTMLNSKTKKKGTFITAMTFCLIGGTIFAFADTPQDHGIENYTFINQSKNNKEIPNKENISKVTLNSDSIEVSYNNGEKQEFNNKEYSLNLKAAE